MALYQQSTFGSAQIHTQLRTSEENDRTNIQYDRTYLLDALNKGTLTISVSQLLGCDYVFIKHTSDDQMFDSENIQRTINDILRLLTVTPKQTIFIAVTTENEDPQFTRYDFTWSNQNAESITKIDIVQKEQIDFMEMIYNCSSPI